MNTYGFAEGDPVNFSDPMGLNPLPIPAAGAVLLASPGGQRAIERGSLLARNLLASGKVRQFGEAAHHIVAKGAGRADAARRTLERVGVDIDEAVNGVFLPATREYVGRAANHLNVHTTKYYEAVTSSLANVKTREDAIMVLGAIRDALINGTFPR